MNQRIAVIAPEFALLKTLNTKFTNPYSLTASAIIPTSSVYLYMLLLKLNSTDVTAQLRLL